MAVNVPRRSHQAKARDCARETNEREATGRLGITLNELQDFVVKIGD